MNINEQEKITYEIQPEKASNKDVKWSSSNEAVATVDAFGRITAQGEGACTVSAMVDNQSATVYVSVSSITKEDA